MWTRITISFLPFLLTASTIYTVAQYPVRNEADVNNMFLIALFLSAGYFVAAFAGLRYHNKLARLAIGEMVDKAIQQRVDDEIESIINSVFKKII